MYATESEQSQKWIDQNSGRTQRVVTRFRPLYAGFVSVSTRDAFDVYEENTRGMIGYTLRRGTNAILHTTGNMTDDPEFFMQAVRAANPNNLIDQKTHFTNHERREHAEIHRPIINRINSLAERDGLPATQAFERYAGQYEQEGDISTSFASTLQLNAQLEPATKHRALFATYNLGEKGHLLIVKRSGNDQRYLSLTHEYAVDGSTVKRTFEQPWDYPDMLVADKPSKSLTNFDRHDNRLFALNNGDALDLNALLSTL
jgi:hypothetical protein